MPKFKKIEINEEAKVTIFVPEEAELNHSRLIKTPPLTEYEDRRCSVGREAIRKITGK